MVDFLIFLPLSFTHDMAKRKSKLHNTANLIKVIKEWPNPMYDKRHGYYIYVEGRARSNQTREEHIVERGHNLKARDLKLVPEGINNYFAYKKDPVYKNTFNYYIARKGKDKGFVKVSVRISDNDPKHAWIKTIFIAYKIKK